MQEETGNEAYKKVIDYLCNKKDSELIAIAIEASKSNPDFFLRALEKVRSTKMSNTIMFKGSNAQFDSKRLYDVFSHISDEKMVAAIKLLRELTGLGLKEAKDICDDMRQCARYGVGGKASTVDDIVGYTIDKYSV